MIDYVIPEGHEEISRVFYNEIWYGNEYNQYGVCVEPLDVVLDCGSNIGIFTDYAIFNGASKVYAFEADEAMYASFTKTFMRDRYISKVKNFRAKVGDGEGLMTIRDIFDTCNVSKFNFAKIDIEGYEFDLILNTPDVILQRIDKWAVEFHLWGYHQNTATEMKRMLKIIEKFNDNNFNTYIKHIHKDLNLMMFYAKKR
jgi:hypothetical protein